MSCVTEGRDPLDGLREVEHDLAERRDTGNCDMDDTRLHVRVRDGVAAWEKERAEDARMFNEVTAQIAAHADKAEAELAALRAALERIEGEMLNEQADCRCGNINAYRVEVWMNALRAAREGGK